MAKKNPNGAGTNSEATATDTGMDVGPDRSGALAAGWDGIYHLFGGRVERWDIVEDGLIARGFTVAENYDPEVILNDINRKGNRRPPLFPTITWIVDPTIEPPHFPNNLAITTFLVQFFKGSVEAGTSKSPKYARDAAQDYKERQGTKVNRGPKPKAINLKDLASADVSLLTRAGVKPEDAEHLRNMLDQYLLSQGTANVVSTETATDAVEATA